MVPVTSPAEQLLCTHAFGDLSTRNGYPPWWPSSHPTPEQSPHLCSAAPCEEGRSERFIQERQHTPSSSATSTTATPTRAGERRTEKTTAPPHAAQEVGVGAGGKAAPLVSAQGTRTLSSSRSSLPAASNLLQVTGASVPFTSVTSSRVRSKAETEEGKAKEGTFQQAGDASGCSLSIHGEPCNAAYGLPAPRCSHTKGGTGESSLTSSGFTSSVKSVTGVVGRQEVSAGVTAAKRRVAEFREKERLVKQERAQQLSSFSRSVVKRGAGSASEEKDEEGRGRRSISHDPSSKTSTVLHAGVWATSSHVLPTPHSPTIMKDRNRASSRPHRNGTVQGGATAAVSSTFFCTTRGEGERYSGAAEGTSAREPQGQGLSSVGTDKRLATTPFHSHASCAVGSPPSVTCIDSSLVSRGTILESAASPLPTVDHTVRVPPPLSEESKIVHTFRDGIPNTVPSGATTLSASANTRWFPTIGAWDRERSSTTLPTGTKPTSGVPSASPPVTPPALPSTAVVLPTPPPPPLPPATLPVPLPPPPPLSPEARPSSSSAPPTAGEKVVPPPAFNSTGITLSIPTVPITPQYTATLMSSDPSPPHPASSSKLEEQTPQWEGERALLVDVLARMIKKECQRDNTSLARPVTPYTMEDAAKGTEMGRAGLGFQSHSSMAEAEKVAVLQKNNGKESTPFLHPWSSALPFIGSSLSSAGDRGRAVHSSLHTSAVEQPQSNTATAEGKVAPREEHSHGAAIGPHSTSPLPCTPISSTLVSSPIRTLSGVVADTHTQVDAGAAEGHLHPSGRSHPREANGIDMKGIQRMDVERVLFSLLSSMTAVRHATGDHPAEQMAEKENPLCAVIEGVVSLLQHNSSPAKESMMTSHPSPSSPPVPVPPPPLSSLSFITPTTSLTPSGSTPFCGSTPAASVELTPPTTTTTTPSSLCTVGPSHPMMSCGSDASSGSAKGSSASHIALTNSPLTHPISILPPAVNLSSEAEVQRLREEVHALREQLHHSTSKLAAWESWYRKEYSTSSVCLQATATQATEEGKDAFSSKALHPMTEKRNTHRIDPLDPPLWTANRNTAQSAFLTHSSASLSFVPFRGEGNGNPVATSLHSFSTTTMNQEDKRPSPSPALTDEDYSEYERKRDFSTVAGEHRHHPLNTFSEGREMRGRNVESCDSMEKNASVTRSQGEGSSSPFYGSKSRGVHELEGSGSLENSKRSHLVIRSSSRPHLYTNEEVEEETVAVIAKGRAIRELALEELEWRE